MRSLKLRTAFSGHRVIRYLTIMFNNEGYKIHDQSQPHYVTFTVVDWVDVFTRKRYKDIVLESFEHCQSEKGMVLYGYVIMSNPALRRLCLRSDITKVIIAKNLRGPALDQTVAELLN